MRGYFVVFYSDGWFGYFARLFYYGLVLLCYILYRILYVHCVVGAVVAGCAFYFAIRSYVN